ncbi:MAG: hypothetical protein ACFNLH_08850 [Corynebacterium matruchotii]
MISPHQRASTSLVKGVRARTKPPQGCGANQSDGDAVLVKGSNGSGAWRLADHLKEVRPR